MIMHKIRKYIGKLKLRRRWKKRNTHNHTWLVDAKSIEIVQAGRMTWGGIRIIDYQDTSIEEGRIRIGSFCSIAEEVRFIRGGEHRIDRVSTFLYRSCYSIEGEENLKHVKDIVIGDDVWIGYGCTILSGSVIGQGAVIGAGSIVRGTVPPYSIYIGNKVVKQRFSPDIIENLLRIDYSKLSDETIKDNIALFYNNLTPQSIDKLVDLTRKHDNK